MGSATATRARSANTQWRRNSQSFTTDPGRMRREIICWYAADLRSLFRAATHGLLRGGLHRGQGCARRDQCAYESRGNRVRLTYLVGFGHFSAPMARISVRLIFALLYRNLMAVCQIGCEPCPPLGRIEIRKYRRAKVFCQRWRMLMWLARFLLVMPQSSNLSGVSNDEST